MQIFSFSTSLSYFAYFITYGIVIFIPLVIFSFMVIITKF